MSWIPFSSRFPPVFLLFSLIFIWDLYDNKLLSFGSKGLRRVCYYTNWAQYRPVSARMTPEKIDTKLCTHLIYAFAKLDFKSEINFTEWNDPEL